MKTLVLFAVCFGMISSWAAERPIAEYDWQKVIAARQLRGGVPVKIDGRVALRVANTNNGPVSIQVLMVRQPPITKDVYALVGEVKYEGVRGDGYLEMVNCYTPLSAGMPEGQFFSRTLDGSGALGKLNGTSDWREFVIPFDRAGWGTPPNRLEVNVVLPAQGTVYLGSPRLVEYTGKLSELVGGATGKARAWWPEQTAGLVGGIAGAVLGCLAGLLGWLAGRGKARSFVVSTCAALIGIGGLATLLGVLAILVKQPFWIWFPLLLAGVLTLLVLPSRLYHFKRHYEALDLRRMSSLDALGG